VRKNRILFDLVESLRRLTAFGESEFQSIHDTGNIFESYNIYRFTYCIGDIRTIIDWKLTDAFNRFESTEGHVMSTEGHVRLTEGHIDLTFVRLDRKVVIVIVVEGRENREKAVFLYF
jgi:hypothetical protein